MTLVNAETGEVVEPMSADDARRLTERIRIAASNYTEAKAKVLMLVDEAKAGGAHVALGYKSWTAYLSDVLSDEPLRLAREDRRELVVRLADEGMSGRAIAPIVGASEATIRRDVATASNDAVEPTVRETEGLDGRRRLSVVATPPQKRQAQRDDAEVLLNRIQSLADQAARQAAHLTPAQIARVKPKADLWTVGLGESLEALQRLLTSLTEEK